MRHFYQEIQGYFDFEDMYRAMIKEAPASGAHFVEVGVWKGRSAIFMGVEIFNSLRPVPFTSA